MPSPQKFARRHGASVTNRITESTMIVGPGRLGQALGRLLSDAGVPVRFVAARKLAVARRAVEFIGSGEPVSLGRLGDRELAQVRIVLLTVSDSAIAEVASYLAVVHDRTKACDAEHWSGKIVLHTCGSLPATGPASVLASLRDRGASVGSLHPFQTVRSPAAGVNSLYRCFWATEGDPAALRLGANWVSLRSEE